MTRKITTILLALALCLTLLPVGAGAAGTTGWVLQKGTDDTLKYGGNDVQTASETVTYGDSEQTASISEGYILNGGTYKLGADVTINKPLIIKGNVTLDLTMY